MLHFTLTRCVASLAAACAVAFALSARADDTTTPSVIITAARAAQALTDALPHTTVLTRLDIERSQAIDLAALLATEAGIQLASNGARGSATSLFVRGAPTRQVLVLIDGVALARQDATGQVGIEHLMLHQIERIEIVRGNVSALYGSGAVGGVIQVFTRRAGQPQASLRAEAGSRGLAHVSAQVGGAAGRTQWSFNVSADRERGVSALNTQQVPAANPDRDGYRNTSAGLKLAHEWASGQLLGVAWLHSDGRLDYDSAFAAPADLQSSRTQKQILYVSSDNELGANWASHLLLSHQTDRTRNVETGDFGYADRYKTSVGGLSWSHDWRLSSATRLGAGVDLQRQRIAADDGFGGAYDRARNLSALFVNGQTRFGDHALSAAVRHDHIDGVGSRASGNLGWGWTLGPAWKAFANAGTAFSAPPLGYLYAPFFGNPDLRPEVSRSLELGLQWAVAGQRVRATWFQTRVEDELEFDLQTYTFGNLARTRNRGLEVSYASRLAGTDLRASLTAQRPVDDATGARRLRRSDLLASLAATRELGAGWRAGLTARYAGERVDSGNQRLPSYLVIDATTQWDFSPSGQWFARIENVGDVHYQTAFGYNQPPRGVFAGVRWKLAL